jgi:hypothetical protein
MIEFQITEAHSNLGPTELPAGRSGARIPVGARDISFLQNVQTGSGTFLAPYSVCVSGLFLAGKAVGA